MTTFDLERALKEEIAGLVDIHTELRKRAHALQQQYVEIEHEFNAVNKLLGFAAIELARKRQVLAALLASGQPALPNQP